MCVSILSVPPGKCSAGDRLERGRWCLSGTPLEFTHFMGGSLKSNHENEDVDKEEVENRETRAFLQLWRRRYDRTRFKIISPSNRFYLVS